MPTGKGPTSDQARVLRSRGENPENYAHMNRGEITRVMQGMMPLERDANAKDMRATFQRKRWDVIRAKGLKVGMSAYVEKGMLRSAPKKILEITPLGFVRLEGIEREYAPQSIVPLVENGASPG